MAGSSRVHDFDDDDTTDSDGADETGAGVGHTTGLATANDGVLGDDAGSGKPLSNSEDANAFIAAAMEAAGADVSMRSSWGGSFRNDARVNAAARESRAHVAVPGYDEQARGSCQAKCTLTD